MKKKFIYILIILSVILLVGNILTRILTDKGKKIVINEISRNEIDTIFVNTISRFNLDSNWVRKINIKPGEYDSLKYVYKIDLPTDLPPVLILRDLRKNFLDEPVEIISDEKTINGYTTINLFSNDNLKLQASLNIKRGIVRKHSEFALVLTDFNLLGDEEKENIYRSVLNLDILLIPSEQSDSLIKQISENEKTYSVLISDTDEESIYSLKPGDSKVKMQEAVRYTVWNYPDAQLFVIDNSSEIFNSTSFNFVKDEFESRGIKLRLLSELISLPANLSEAKSLLSFYIESRMGKEGEILLIPASLYVGIQSVLLNTKKQGSKFYSPRRLEMLKKGNNN